MSDVHLYAFQQKALDKVAGRSRVAFFHDMGLGKTFTGSEKMKELDEAVNLVICQKSKIEDWMKHFKEHYPEYDVFDLTNKKGLNAFIDSFAYDGVSVGIINYDLAWRRKELLRMHGFTLMLDESSLIQNRKAQRTKFILKLDASNVILLSGTPCSGKYENLWTQAHLLGWNISESLYNSQYVNYELIEVGYGYRAQVHKIVDRKNPYKNVERLKAKLREHGADFLKTEECFDLPEQNFIDVTVPRSKEYVYFMNNSIVTVDGVELVGSTSLTKRLRARMLCGIYSDAKMEAFQDLLESTNDRLIVFYSFTEELERLAPIAEKLNKPLSIINGSVKDLDAYESEESSVTFLQYQAGAKGLNLQKANRIIFYSPTERCEDYMQALKRIHRINQTRPCFYYRMICSGSVEERIYNALERGVDYTDNLFKEDFRC